MKTTIDGSKKQNRIKKFISLSAVILSLMLLNTGCLPNNFTSEEKAAFLKTAKEIVSDFLKEQYSGAKVKNIQPETDVATDGSGYELTEFASGQFSWQGQTFDFLVNTESCQVYTSVYLTDVVEGLKEALLQGLCIDASEAAVTDFTTITYLPIKGMGKGSYIDSAFQNVLPQRDSTEELLKEILQDKEEYTVTMHIQYKGDELPQGITEQDAPFPALSVVKFYHIAEEHELCKEEYSSSLQSLSKEILRLTFSQGSPGNYSYTRNQVIKQDGFYVVYNAYDRTRREDVVTESVITEEDITFTVMEGYISLDCAKDNYVMYLSADDKEKATKYRYAFDQGSLNKVEIKEGMWYVFEDRYVYADNIYVKTPHEFNDNYSVENIIYTKQASENPPILPQSTKFEYIY